MKENKGPAVVSEHSGSIHRVAFAPDFRPLRSDPRFPDLLRRIGLEIPQPLETPKRR